MAFLKNKVGRPLKIKTVEEMIELIEEYFESCFEDIEIRDKEGKYLETKRVQVKPFTVSGLAVSIGLDRQGLLEYQGRKQFADTIKEAKAIIEQYTEECLYTNKNTAGVIFNLKNNWNWVDKHEIDNNVEVKRKLEDFL